MEKSKRLCFVFVAYLLALVISTVSLAQTTPAEPIVKITLIHLNDLYEITPVGGGKVGGLARLATLRKNLLEQNPNTFMILAGDVLSPSALGTATVDGERLAGKQIVAVLNAIGLNFSTFGNHEFDLREPQLLQRLKESNFKWFSSNVRRADGSYFPGVADSAIFVVTDRENRQVRIGMFGLTLDSNRQPYVAYADPFEIAKQRVSAMKAKVDILVALTHLRIDQDVALANTFPEIDLIMGGHEHENIQLWRGADLTPIFKADANVRTVYIHDLLYNTATKDLKIFSRLQSIDATIPEDPQTAELVQHWVDVAYAGFKKAGFEPERVVTTSLMVLDGREGSVRNQSTSLTELIAQGMMKAAGTELAIFNGGSIRIDDELPPGPITEYDVIRVLPFGGMVLSVEMKGSLLTQILKQGQANKGSGGFLQTAGISRSQDESTWLIKGVSIDPQKTYVLAINDFLVTGREQGLDYLNRDNKDLRVIKEHVDVRKALIEQLKTAFGSK